MATKNIRRYEPPPKSEAKRERQRELFNAHLPAWRKLSDDDIASLTAILFAYFVARLKG